MQNILDISRENKSVLAAEILIGSYFTYKSYKLIKQTSENIKMQSVAQSKRDERD
jgi:hypothetical protein